MTLDLNGFSIIGNGAIATPQQNENGIYVFNSSDITIKNGDVTRWNNGIFFDGAFGSNFNNTVDRMRVYDNVGPNASGIYGEGIQVFRDGGHTFTNNLVFDNGPFSGINAYTSVGNTFDRNTVFNNNIITEDDHHGGSGQIMQDIGIWIINLASTPASSSQNVITNNRVVGNGLDGIQLSRFSNDNVVSGNVSANNGFGQPAGFGVPARSPSCADGDGVANFGSFNEVGDNVTSGNGGNGIAVYRSVSSGTPVGGQSNVVEGNRSFNNGSGVNCAGIAFDLLDANLSPPCDANTWSSNTFGTKNLSCIS